MTLEEWTETNQIRAKVFDKPGYLKMMTVGDRSYPNRSELWNLSDYVVTSVEGGSIWLAPKALKEEMK